MKRAKIVQTSRQIIENQLLTALDDKSKVAILLNEKDLTMTIHAFECLLCLKDADIDKDKIELMLTDLQNLKCSAF